MSTAWYEIHIYINPGTDSRQDFEGIFSIDQNTNIITSFYERINDYDINSTIINTNILDTNILDQSQTMYPSYLYNPLLGGLDEYGCNITSITQLGGPGLYQLKGPLEMNGSLIGTSCILIALVNGVSTTYNVNYLITATSAPPDINDPGPANSPDIFPLQLVSIPPSGFANMQDYSLSGFSPDQFSYLNVSQINSILPDRANILNYSQIMALQRPSKYMIWYKFSLSQNGSSPFFNGYLSVNSDTSIITNLFSATNINMNLLAYDSGSDYKFQYYSNSRQRNFSQNGTAFVSSILTNLFQPTALTWKIFGNMNNAILYYSTSQETGRDNLGNPVYSIVWTRYGQVNINAVIVTNSPLNPPCFGENTQILCKVGEEEKYVLITDLKKESLVKTLHSGFVAIDMIGKSKIDNLGTNERVKHRLYNLSMDKYPELTQDLILTGCHSILTDELTDEQRAKTVELMEHIYVTDGKYRLLTCLDDRAVPLVDEREFAIYHIALENEDYYGNYGVYANGLLVETCSQRYMKEFSKMELIL